MHGIIVDPLALVPRPSNIPFQIITFSVQADYIPRRHTHYVKVMLMYDP